MITWTCCTTLHSNRILNGGIESIQYVCSHFYVIWFDRLSQIIFFDEALILYVAVPQTKTTEIKFKWNSNEIHEQTPVIQFHYRQSSEHLIIVSVPLFWWLLYQHWPPNNELRKTSPLGLPTLAIRINHNWSELITAECAKHGRIPPQPIAINTRPIIVTGPRAMSNEQRAMKKEKSPDKSILEPVRT